MNKALVTGATGFVGSNLVFALRKLGWSVRTLVRDPTRAVHLVERDAEIVTGSLQVLETLVEAVSGVDVVFHVAGRVAALNRQEFYEDNVVGTRTVMEACAEQASPPTVVMVSSLAAGGPSTPGTPRCETDPDVPVSAYGESKLAAEHEASKLSDRVPLTIIRPPVVFGPGDRNSLKLFQSICMTRLHAVPGLRSMPMSIVHVADLCTALVQLSESGTRMQPTADHSTGVYCITSGRTITYSEFGRLAAAGLDKRVIVLPLPKTMFWIVGGVMEGIGQVRRRPSIFNWDKVHEAVASGWECTDEKLRHDVGYAPAAPLEQRFNETAAWYREQGWLKS
ncbi:NAD-dependent epimerase/dehydratase family protein [Bythopirellula polymerisocia]|uniref:3 beta-hydroxysteroid dehydrogenase/Delta 5-->4-isomerase n=1 Tax=Bythopirellula polymerisocia TaxID=2528003 RepID=A0A5C6D2B2_9BACT|nr:NAD-dependent epimerase/dehydratase family protein [Bythopirellula polymerisocia]TWU29984.1 3 beta-hydroxysteroid dehydrogenase/Delta 5-->4-isomerase [Bythopirellula polymerisocia]